MTEIPPTEENSKKRSVLGLGNDWPQQVTEQIVSKVDEIRDRTTGPAIKLSRSVVYGLTAFFLLLLSIPFLILGISRGLIEIFDAWIVSDRSTAVWVVYIITGVLWLAVGLLFWRKRPKDAAQTKQRKS
tara:strand:+ start:1697 stop:2083 length:387 start_codon:yes stop_codon:yes gene_type:complete